MRRVEKDEEREYRIMMEAVVDAYDRWERALGWYYYLESRITFPFKAECIKQRAVSPLHEGEVVEVMGMPPEDACMAEMFVTIQWKNRTFGVPLSQLEPRNVDEDTQEAIDDWHYWVARNYDFG